MYISIYKYIIIYIYIYIYMSALMQAGATVVQA